MTLFLFLTQAQLTTKSLQASSFVEILLAIAILAVLGVGFVSTTAGGQSSAQAAGARSAAAATLAESASALRALAHDNFTNLPAGVYGLTNTGGTWTLVPGGDTTNNYQREITITDISATTKQAVITIDWSTGFLRPGSVTQSLVFSDWQRPSTPSVSWQTPVVAYSDNLPGGNNGYALEANENIDTLILVRDGGSRDITYFDISTPDTPVVQNDYNYNNLHDVAFVGNTHAVFSNTQNNREVVATQVSTVSLSITDQLNLNRNRNPNRIIVDNNTLYLTRDDHNKSAEFHIIDVSDPTNMVELSNVDIADDTYDLFVDGTDVFVAGGKDAEVTHIDVSNPSAPTVLETFDVSGNEDLFSITGNSNFILVGADNTGQITYIERTLTGLVERGNTIIGNDVNDIILFEHNGTDAMFVGSEQNGVEFQVIEITSPTSFSIVSQLDLNNDDINEMYYHAAADLVYVAGDGDELLVITPS